MWYHLIGDKMTLNNEFIEEYKRLDRLCRGIYNSDKGITNYIDDMRSSSGLGAGGVVGWNDDFQNLKRLRHIRNSLTHDVGTMESPMCTKGDIEWLRTFFERIRTGDDPLALVRKLRLSKIKVTQRPKSTYIPNPPVNYQKRCSAPQNRNTFFTAFFLFLIFFAVFVVLYKIILG